MLNHIKLFFKLYYKPVNAFGEIIDKGNLWASVFTVLVTSTLFWFSIVTPIYNEFENPANLKHQQFLLRPRIKLTPNPAPSSTPTNTDTTVTTPIATPEEDVEEFEQPQFYNPYSPLIKKPLPIVGKYGWWVVTFSPIITIISALPLIILYVPITILVLIFLEPLGSYGVVFRRDYAPLLACTLMSWAATHLPLSLIGLIYPPTPNLALCFWVLCKSLFFIFMIFALRTVFNASYFSILITLSISWVSIILESAIFWLTSPFLLFWIYYYLRGDVGAVGMDVVSSFRQRQSFRRYLEACTINPQDAEAHYQLGLIHQQRRQYSEAISRFKKAVEIDKREIDAHFQLGIIAREQNRLQEAIFHFDAVVSLNEKHSNSEIWREIGATYEAAGMNDDAKQALGKYVERRPYDAEGLYYYGKTLAKLKEPHLAKEMLTRAIEAVDTAPYHRKTHIARWRKLSQGLLKSIEN